LGLVGTIKYFCRDFGEQQKIEIKFRSHDLTRNLPPEISLSLFRVVQESLHNAAKHSSKIKHFKVNVCGMSDETHLTVSDRG